MTLVQINRGMDYCGPQCSLIRELNRNPIDKFLVGNRRLFHVKDGIPHMRQFNVSYLLKLKFM